jgi:hypothetical protein
VFDLKAGAGGEDIPEDITLSMNANYFLFATLEPARHLAQPRGMPDPNKPTVLTGTPVAGMVYLDRPVPAGYFIFPDLSVRHEGHFRLSFSLYEELKRTEDHDKMEDPSRASLPGETHVTHRLEVKSEVLQVYSAKKFPGLTESTSLSRTVAEQGCRVRIRRDVRMRRGPRDSKGGKEWDDYEESTADQRAKVARTADTPPYNYANHVLGAPPSVMEPTARPRSASNGSHQSLAASLSRRQSQQEQAQNYHHQQQQQQAHQQQHQQQYGGTAPQTPQSGIVPGSAYGPSPSQQYSQPPYVQQAQPAPPPPAHQPMQQPPVQYQPHSYTPAPAASQQSAHYGYQPAPTYQAQYSAGPPEANGHAHRASNDWSTAPMPAEYQRPSIHHAPVAPVHAVPASQPAPPSYSSHPYQQPAQPSQPYQTQSPQQPHYYAPIEVQSTRAPPPEPIQPPHRASAPTPLSSGTKTYFHLPPISQAFEPASPAVPTPTSTNSYFPNSYVGQVSAAESHKRAYGSTFSTAHHDVSQKAGARPDSMPQPNGSLFTDFDVDDDDEDEGVLTAGYKRADGQVITRKY